MKQRKLLGIGALLLALLAQRAIADDVRYFEENGITYRETTQVVRRPIPHTQMQQRDSTYYRERYSTDLQDVTRTYQVPVNEYQWETHWEGRWNPFSQPYLTYRLVPRTRWETKTENVKIPVARRELVPEKITQQVPVTTQKIAEERIVTRVAVGTTPAAGSTNPGASSAASAATTASIRGGSTFNTATGQGVPPATLPTTSADGVGGVSKIDPNQPRQNPDWRASDALLRR